MSRVFSVFAAARAGTRLTGFLIPLLVVLVSCGGETNDTASKAAPLKPAEFNACELLSAKRAGELMNEPVTKSDNTVQMTNSVSQCVHTFSEPRKRITLLVRHSSAGIPPLSRAQEAAKQRNEADDSNAMDRLAGAIEAGQNIDGLGTLAYAFELGGFQLWAYWGKNYYLTVTVNGVDDNAAALEVVKAAAQTVIGQL